VLLMVFETFNSLLSLFSHSTPSFGICLWEILTREEPFSEFSDYDEFVEAVCDHNHRPRIPDDCLNGLKFLIKECWSDNPSSRPSFTEIVKRLDDIVIASIVDDQLRQQLWKQNFARKEQVSWQKEFVGVFAKALGFDIPSKTSEGNDSYAKEINVLLSTLPWMCLEAVLVDKTKDGEKVVNLEKFGNILAWFGPIKKPDSKESILSTIHSVLSHGWFHGTIEYNDAVNKLKNKVAGTFLVRFSNPQNPGCFAISKVTSKSKIIHYRVQHPFNGDFFLPNGSSYPSLEALVKGEEQNLKLEFPCPESPYLYLFQNINKSSDGLYDEVEEQ